MPINLIITFICKSLFSNNYDILLLLSSRYLQTYKIRTSEMVSPKSCTQTHTASDNATSYKVKCTIMQCTELKDDKHKLKKTYRP